MRFSLTGGQRADVSQALPLLTGIETGAVIADKGYESNRLLAFIQDQGAEAVIPPKSNRRDPWEYDRELYRERNLIERAFNKLKQWRRIATRYDRKSLYFLSALHLVASCPASTIFAGWRQSVLPVHLLGLDALLGSVGPVAGDVKLQDDGVVHDPVNRRGGGHGVGEDALPLREDQV